MKRLWIPLSNLEIFDSMHTPDGNGGFIVDREKDGQTTEQHREGVDYIKQVLLNGQKIMPILVKDNGDGTYKRLDGFKRCWAYLELGYKFIEAFVCAEDEYQRAAEYDFGHAKIRAWHGGLPKEDYGLFEGGEKESFNYDETIFLYKSPKHDGLRIEVSECVHVHFGAYGKYRFTLGRRDFEMLAEAISLIE